MKIKGVNIDSLNKRQMSAMKKHSKHHTAKHLKAMVSLMNKGSTFTESHKLAMKKVGR
tara:strand:- start:1278 stop:1451 length:174 start_codon:yes stop_codon:yes gene_type:complete